MYFRWRSLAEGQSLPTKLVLVRTGKSGREAVKSRFQDGADFRARRKKETANAHAIPKTFPPSLMNSETFAARVLWGGS